MHFPTPGVRAGCRRGRTIRHSPVLRQIGAAHHNYRVSVHQSHSNVKCLRQNGEQGRGDFELLLWSVVDTVMDELGIKV